MSMEKGCGRKVALGGARVNGQTIQLEATQAITDTGSEMISMGQRDADRLLKVRTHMGAMSDTCLCPARAKLVVPSQ
jgi:hypothetical protein